MSQSQKTYRDDGSVWEEFWGPDITNCHRVDGPAYILYYPNGTISYIEWSLNDRPHRTDGPAMISYDNDGNIVNEEYCLLGWRQTKENMETPGFIDAFILEHS